MGNRRRERAGQPGSSRSLHLHRPTLPRVTPDFQGKVCSRIDAGFGRCLVAPGSKGANFPREEMFSLPNIWLLRVEGARDNMDAGESMGSCLYI